MDVDGTCHSSAMVKVVPNETSIIWEGRLNKPPHLFMKTRRQTIRLYPTPKQIKLFWQYVDARWFVWNWALETLEKWKKEFLIANPGGKFKNDWNHLSREFAKLRAENSGLERLNSHTSRATLHDLKTAFSNFFNRVKKNDRNKNCPQNPFGYPQSYKRFDKSSFFIPELCRIENKRLIAIGQQIKLSRDIPGMGQIGKAVRILCIAGKWYASFTIKIDVPELPSIDPKNLIGLDIGLLKWAQLSDGEVIENPRFLRSMERKLVHWQRKLARQKKGSNRRNVIKRRISKIHASIANRRKHFAHLKSKEISDKYDAVCIESHSISDQIKENRLAKSLSDAGHGFFRAFLGYKLPDRGKQLLKSGKFFKSTGVCYICGFDVGHLSLNVRKWTCPNCGTTHDRDLAAAKVLELEGHKQVLANAL